MRVMRGVWFLLLMCTSSLLAATRLVTVAGVDAGDCTVAPCATLNYAIGQAVAGDTIDVGPGAFNNGGVAVNVNKTLIVQGEQAGVDARTRGVVAESILTMPVQLVADNIVFDGFTINCAACAPLGAGLATLASNSGYQVVNNIITLNPIGISFASNGTNFSFLRFNRIEENNNGFGVLSAAGTGIYSDAGVTNAEIGTNRINGHQTANINIIGGLATATVTIIGNHFFNDTTNDVNAIVLFENTNTIVDDNVMVGGIASTIFLGGGNVNTVITDNLLQNSTSTAITVSDVGPGPNGLVTIERNTIINNLRGISVGHATPTPVEAHFNRIEDNGTDVRTTVAGAVIDGENNWWGCNEGPATCATTSILAGSTADLEPWIVMDIVAAPPSITIAQTSTVTADFNQNSDGAAISGFPENTFVSFTASGGTVAPPSDATSGGAASTVFTPTSNGTATVNGILDDESVPVNITVAAATTAVTLSSNNNPSDFGEAVTFTATVDPAATGTISFIFNMFNMSGPVPIVAGQAQFTTSTLSPGTYTVVAQYSGDATFDPASSPPLTQVVAATGINAPALSWPMLIFLALALGMAAMFVMRRM